MAKGFKDFCFKLKKTSVLLQKVRLLLKDTAERISRNQQI